MSRGPLRRLARRLGVALAGHLGPRAVRLVVGTCRVAVYGPEDDAPGAYLPPQRAVFAFWHSRLLLPIWAFRGSGVRVLVSRHVDGEIAARILRKLGYVPIRGSADRQGSARKGGARALLALAREARLGAALAFTPDGPRGPAREVGRGLPLLARLTGYAVVPVGLAASRTWRLRSWDGLEVPWPRAWIVIAFGPPVPAAEACAPLLAARLRGATEQAERLLQELLRGRQGRGVRRAPVGRRRGLAPPP